MGESAVDSGLTVTNLEMGTLLRFFEGRVRFGLNVLRLLGRL